MGKGFLGIRPIEWLIVVVILVILAMIVVPQFRTAAQESQRRNTTTVESPNEPNGFVEPIGESRK